jgi:hypothetical protein
MAREQRDIAFSRSQWDDLDGKYIQSKVEILTKQFRFGVRFQISIGCRDNTDIDIAGFLFTDAFDLTFL